MDGLGWALLWAALGEASLPWLDGSPLDRSHGPARATYPSARRFPCGLLPPWSPTRVPSPESRKTAARRSGANGGDWTCSRVSRAPTGFEIAHPWVPFLRYTNYLGMVVVVCSACATSGPPKPRKLLLSHPQPQDSSAPALQHPRVIG